jgi:hypothetical protein
MSPGSRRSRRPPDVDATEILKRKRLEAELFSLDGQVRRFDRIRERLLAAGNDPSESYRRFEARRKKLVAALKKSARANPVDPQLPVARLDESLVNGPISPARFDPRLGMFGFGSAGVVQLAPAGENKNVVAQGPFPHSGEIVTIPGSYPGDVAFAGNLAVGPDEIAPDQYDPTINYFWIRSWKYLIPFPPPTAVSRFTYRFEVYAFCGLLDAGEGNVMSFVSLGETSNLTTGTNVAVGIDAGWPLVVDLADPGPWPSYNGHYGYVEGHISVQRSFTAPAGDVPGVAVVVGVIVALPMMSQVDLFFPGLANSKISIASQNEVGRVAYSYEPQLVNQQAEQ